MARIRQLSNGIRVVLERMSYFKTAAFGVFVRVGSVNETRENNGISHVIEHMLFQGTKKRTARQLAADTAAIGDNVNAFTSKEYTAYYGVTLSEYLPRLIELIGDMLNHSIMDEDALKKEKGVILEEIDMYDDSPEDLVHELLQKQVWKDHPLGFLISGEKDVVRRISRDEILDFMKKHYTADHMVLSVAGHFDENEIYALLEEAFGKVEQSGEARLAAARSALDGARPKDSPYHREYPKSKKADVSGPCYIPGFCTREKEIEQLHMNLAFPSISTEDPEKYTLAVMNSVLGGSNNSRLFQVIREELGLAYSVYSYGSSYETAGLFQIDVTLNPSQAEIAFDRIFAEIEKLKASRVQESELGIHVSQVRTELAMSQESPRSRMNANARAVLFRGKIESLKHASDAVAAVGPDSIQKFASKYLDPSLASLCLVGPVGRRAKARWEKKLNELRQNR